MTSDMLSVQTLRALALAKQAAKAHQTFERGLVRRYTSAFRTGPADSRRRAIPMIRSSAGKRTRKAVAIL